MKNRPSRSTSALLLSTIASVAWSSPAPLEFLPASGTPHGSRSAIYGGRSRADSAREKETGAFVRFLSDDRDYSGWMLVLPEEHDLSSLRDRGVLELRVRGAKGGERLWAELVDAQGPEVGAGVQSRRPVAASEKPGTWTTVRIPLWQFPSSGPRYAFSTRTMGSGNVDWKRIREFRLIADKGTNSRIADTAGLFRVDIAGIRIVPDFPDVRRPDIDAPGLGARPGGRLAARFVDNTPPGGSWDYSYGGSTDALWSTDEARNRGAVLYRGDDREYSGWTIHLQDPVDVSGSLAKGALRLKLRGAKGGERVILGLISVPADGSERKPQVRVELSRRLQLGRKWQEVSIPLSEFGNTGLWWNAQRGVEVPAELDWKRLQEFRISSERGANRSVRDSSGIFEVQVADVRVEADPPQPWDAQAHWAAFRSKAAPVVASDTLYPPVRAKVPLPGMEWAVADSIPLRTSDWSRHAAVRITTTAPLEHRVALLHLVDSSGETWSTSFPMPVGTGTTTVPFSRFVRNPSLQGPDARTDGRMDLEKVRSAWFVSGWTDMSARTRLERLVLSNDLHEVDSAKIARVRVNTVGYRPGSTKRFLSAVADRSFALLDSTGKSVLTGELSPSGWWEAAQESLWVGDFTRWSRPGTYRVAVGREKSAPFRIGEDVYDSLAAGAVRGFRYERAEPLGPWAGTWSRGAHPDTGLRTLEIPGGPAKWSAPGGWYDAGDYGKYVVNAGISVWSLLVLDQLVRDSAARQEAEFEVDWLERMQDKDGGVVFKIGSKTWSRFVLPERDTLERFAMGKSTTSALDFAAVLAQSARACAKTDPVRSARLLGKARKAYLWASGRPFVAAPDETGGTGSYEDPSADDEFAWAATEIWLASGKASDRSEAVRRLGRVEFPAAPDWPHVQDLALVSLALSGRKDSLVDAARTHLERLSDSVHAAIEGSAAREPLVSFPWGSNSFLLNHAIALAVSHRLAGNPQRLSDAQELLDYALGRNGIGRSFVTGFGDHPPLHPHLRPLGTGRPAIPGFLVGGPHPGRQDDLSREPDGVVYPWTEPARAWVDRIDAYAGNEVGINWNASLSLVAGYLAREGRKP